MAKLLVLYYSSYGHVEAMATAIATGITEAGGQATVRRVPETAPVEVAQAAHFKLEQKADFATIDELCDYDGIIVGAPTRFGRMPAQMAQFWDQSGSHWMQGSLIGKVGAAFTSTATQHGGQETTLFSILTTLLHHGMVVTGLPYSFQGQMGVDEVNGGTPYGASTIAGGDGARLPSEIELGGARFLGAHVAKLAEQLRLSSRGC